MAKENNLVLATAGVLVAAAILENKRKLDKQKTTGHIKPEAKMIAGLAPRLIAITLLIVVLTFTVDQAPEFGGPLALLILVAALIGSSGVFADYFKETQR